MGRKSRDQSVRNESIQIDIKGHKFDREFIFGPAKNAKKDFVDINWIYCSQKLCQNFYHFGRPLRSITLNSHDENYGGLITSMRFGDRTDSNIGPSYVSQEAPLTISAQGGDEYLCFESIKCQYVYFYNGAYDGWLAGINYIRLTPRNGEPHEKGKLVEFKENSDEKYLETKVTAVGGLNNLGHKDREVAAIYFRPIVETGNLFITGVAFSRKGLLCLQIADIRRPEPNNLLSVYHFGGNRGAYDAAIDCSDVSDSGSDWLANVINEKFDTKSDFHIEFKKWKQFASQLTVHDLVVFGHRVAIDNNDIWKLWIDLLVRGGGSAGYNDPRPLFVGAFISLIEQCLVEGDVRTMHSVFAIQRFLDHVIQTKFQSKQIICSEDPNHWLNVVFQGAYKYRFITKSRAYWHALYSVLGIVRKIQHFKPSQDCYTLAYLQPSTFNNIQAIVVFITQIALFGMVVSSLKVDDLYTIIDLNHIESLAISILVTFIVHSLSSQQFNATRTFLQTFDGAKSSKVMVLNIIVNQMMSVLMIPLNFVIVASTKDRFDLILNSVASLFILELDNQIIDLGPKDDNTIYLSFLQRKLDYYFNQIPDEVHNSNTWTGRIGVDHEKCQLKFD